MGEKEKKGGGGGGKRCDTDHEASSDDRKEVKTAWGKVREKRGFFTLSVLYNAHCRSICGAKLDWRSNDDASLQRYS